jgi:hypothetical protein
MIVLTAEPWVLQITKAKQPAVDNFKGPLRQVRKNVPELNLYAYHLHGSLKKLRSGDTGTATN